MTTYTGNLDQLLVIKVDPALKTQLAAQAEAQQISLSAVARLALRAGLATQQQPSTLQPEVSHG
jgi:predicted HicB family RNase H-like nuclease